MNDNKDQEKPNEVENFHNIDLELKEIEDKICEEVKTNQQMHFRSYSKFTNFRGSLPNYDDLIDEFFYLLRLESMRKTEKPKFICNCCNKEIKENPIEDKWDAGFICDSCNSDEDAGY